MTLRLLTPDFVEVIHDAVLNPGELAGRARYKSLAVILAHIDNRIAYGMVEDAFDLAAAYAVAIARGHCFNDAHKRTAFRVMDVCLDLNGISIPWDTEEVGQIIIRCARGG
ncbi:type II toxin-antitoxin system death-on-curing family toxin [Frigidibacter sp. ROC022]|uniref:type II toxin-antitoxin system death-on-curing family toxin n=1 Tax=Frigidibacter sp. ROC022 TaxID=2971796 RepID=UPI00215B2A96|nr:type II toxin-antitoxin system death-on-curing family toxin [Frigidibacter sp. ROC022]MCR8725432.1 type II toxin-antitoxin system death-on-curing family toxin [Frigidibacter sp. ROC022]